MAELKSIIGDTDKFLENIYRNLEEAGIKTEKYFLDHICYRTASQDEYLQKKAELLTHGEMLVEAPVNGRLIATFKFSKNLAYKNIEIPMIELPSPKPGKVYESGLEHVEFVIDESLEDFMKRYSDINFEADNINNEMNPDIKITFSDGLTVKFHVEPLDKIIEKEKAMML